MLACLSYAFWAGQSLGSCLPPWPFLPKQPVEVDSSWKLLAGLLTMIVPTVFTGNPQSTADVTVPSAESAVHFVAWFSFCHILQTVAPCSNRCVPFPIMSNLVSLTQGSNSYRIIEHCLCHFTRITVTSEYSLPVYSVQDHIIGLYPCNMHCISIICTVKSPPNSSCAPSSGKVLN